jgi:hypothetical protein
MCTNFKNYVNTIVECDNKFRIDIGGKYSFPFYGFGLQSDKAKKILDVIYENSGDFKLNRKYENYLIGKEKLKIRNDSKNN